MWNKLFWKEAGERAIKSFVQTVVVLIGTDLVNIASFNWGDIIGIGATMALVSLLTSIGSAPVGSDNSPSLVTQRAPLR